MLDVVSAKDITLRDLETQFDLRLSEDSRFFTEWQTDGQNIAPEEKRFLDLAKSAYLNLVKYPTMLENAVKQAVVFLLLNPGNDP